MTATQGDIDLADVDEILTSGSGGVTLDAAAGDITVAADSANTEIKTTGTATLTGKAIGGANPLDIEDATALTISDLDGATKHIQIREQTASTIAGTTITVATATSGDIDINYDGADAVAIDNGHALTSIVLSDGGNFSYTSTDADALTLTISHTGIGDVTYDSLSTGILTVAASSLTNGNLEIHNDVGITVSGQLDTSTTNGNLILEALTGIINLDAVDDILTAGGGDVTVTATAGDITIDDATDNDEIVNTGTTGTVTLTGAAIGATNALDLNGATALVINDLDGATKHIKIDEQTASTIADTTITVATATSGTIDIDYVGDDVVDIDNGHVLASIVLSDGSFSYTATAGDINVSGAINAAISPTGGVSLIADSGKIYTTGGNDDTLNVAITGSSNQADDKGVGLPGDSNQKAAILIKSSDSLILGTDATLTANGTYNTTYDDRASINFLDSAATAKDPGSAFDLAIYLASTGGDVTVNSEVTMTAANGTMVIDAYDTVTFGDTFEDSTFGATNRLEASSRISEILNDAYILGKLPHADEFGAGKNPWAGFGGEYVLRGGRPEAWVLKWIDSAPLPLPQLAPLITFEPEREDDSEVEEIEKDGEPADLEGTYLSFTDILAQWR
ncbi:hypothetical protein ES703_78283 [subsurface metagenome]